VGWSLWTFAIVYPAKWLTVLILTNTAVEVVLGQFPAQIRDAVYAAQNF
jgi:hypothetical protein